MSAFDAMVATGEGPVTVREIDESEAATLIAGKGSWRQFPAYAAAAARRVRARSRYLLVARGSRALAVANVRTRSIPLVGATSLISHGPTLLSSPDHWIEDLPQVLGALAGAAPSLGLGELVIDPPVEWALAGLDPMVDAGAQGTARRDPAGTPYRTYLMDLRQSPDELRMGFSREWRKDLNKGLRAGFDISCSDRPDDFRKLAPLIGALTERKGFGLQQDCAFFEEVARASGPGEKFLIHLLHKDGELVAGQIAAYSGATAVGLLGAATPEGLRNHASRVVYWEVMETARSLGFPFYDLGGYDESENPDVFKFK
jgi:hypothetical protein